MGEKFLNLTAVQVIKTWIKSLFATKSDLSALSARVDDIVAEGGEPNVIETVKVNGAALTPDANKAVDVSVPTSTSDLTNDGDGDSRFATEAYVAQNGGKIDVIKVNGTAQTITNKEVDITVPTAGSAQATSGYATYGQLQTVEGNIPTAVSDLTNDSGFQTASDVSTAIESAVVGALKPKGSTTFANLPALAAGVLNNLYNITDAFTTTADFVEGAGKAYPAGTNVAIINVGTEQSPTYKYDVMVGQTDLSAYWTSTTGQNNTLEAATTTEINNILNAE